MTPNEYRVQDGVGIAQLITQGQVNAAEVAGAAISLIEALNPRLNAVVLDRFDAARAEAERLHPRGPLAGAPFLLKDVNLFAADMPTRFASRFFAGAEPKPDSTMVRRWRQAGLLILGRTNTPEFAGDFITEPVFYGPTLNPWNQGVTVGGSSGGAAAAVASGMVPLAHGTDLGGSIRIPAACCGVFGFKPSVGLNPLGPYWDEVAGGLDADHVLTRSVRDSAASLDVTAGPDAGSRFDRLPPPGGFLAGLVAPLPRLRIGVALDDPGGRRAGASQAAAVERTARLLSGLSHHLEPYAFPSEALPGPWFDALWTTDILHLVQERAAELGRDPREEELDGLTRAALRHARTLSAADYLAARLAMGQAAQAIGRSMEHLDIVLTPSLATDPPALGEFDFGANGQDLDRWNARGYAFAPFSTPANLAGQPSASCPVMIGGNGLPLAVQITGKPGADLLVLQLARELEDATEWQRTFQGLWKRLA